MYHVGSFDYHYSLLIRKKKRVNINSYFGQVISKGLVFKTNLNVKNDSYCLLIPLHLKLH